MQVILNDITRRYGNFTAVKDLNLTIASGALHFILGPSGCGKTTLLRMLAGLETPTTGSILFDGQDVTQSPAADRGIGMVFQNYALWPHMTVEENILYGLKLKHMKKSERQVRLGEVLDMTQLERFRLRYPGQLSGGQQQRVALARSLAINPKLILLDEPLSNLDAQLRLEMRDNISRIHKKTGITTVYVTHDQKEALSMGTAISIMHGGHLIQTATPRDMYHSPESPFVAGFIGETNLLKGKVAAFRDGGLLIETDVGALFASRGSRTFSVGDSVILSIRPQAIQLTENKQSVNGFPARVGRNTYLGEMEQLELVNGSTSLKATVLNTEPILHQEGEDVWCHVPPTSLLALPNEELRSQRT